MCLGTARAFSDFSISLCSFQSPKEGGKKKRYFLWCMLLSTSPTHTPLQWSLAVKCLRSHLLASYPSPYKPAKMTTKWKDLHAASEMENVRTNSYKKRVLRKWKENIANLLMLNLKSSFIFLFSAISYRHIPDSGMCFCALGSRQHLLEMCFCQQNWLTSMARLLLRNQAQDYFSSYLSKTYLLLIL